jgi:hypothetical protein
VLRREIQCSGLALGLGLALCLGQGRSAIGDHRAIEAEMQRLAGRDARILMRVEEEGRRGRRQRRYWPGAI